MENVSSWLRKVFQRGSSQYITIVSGLPRSGTSMMMRMLEAGGIPPLTDGKRGADENNPRGYYEFERVKKLPDGDHAWLAEAAGKSVKVISALLEHLPSGYPYRVVFMQRDLDEVLASQRRMLSRTGKGDDIQDAELKELYAKHLEQLQQMLRRRGEIPVLYLSYNDLILEPEPGIQRLARFLEDVPEREAMRAVIEQTLYRERNLEKVGRDFRTT